jgi:hypothetical protein
LRLDHRSLCDAEFNFTDDLALNGSLDLTSSQRSPLTEFLTLDGLLAFEDTPLGQPQCSTEIPMAPYEQLDYQTQTWCGWMRRGVSLALVKENTVVQPSANSNPVAVLRREHPLAHHNADLVIQALRSFPAMMLRRETFPWYIHRQSRVPSIGSGTAALHEALSNCMSIAQMFALRTPETKPFLWRTIRAEHRRLNKEVCTMPAFLFPTLTTQRCTKCPRSNSSPQCKLA